MYLKVLAFVLIASPAQAQIKVEGPKVGTVGYRSKAKLLLEVEDPQIKCFPPNDDWMAVQDFITGIKYIDFVPGKKLVTKPTIFTFAIAGYKDKKTYLESWEILINPDEDTPIPDPKPKPKPDPEVDVTKTKLYQDLLAAYQVSPNEPAKANLIKVYEGFLAEIKADQYTTYKQANDALAAVTAKVVGNDLTNVRKVVAEFFVAELGTKGSIYDKNKLIAADSKVIACLKAIP